MSLDYVRDNPGEPVPEGTFHRLLGGLCQEGIRHKNGGDGGDGGTS